jgi:hypothetical protein
MVILGPALDSFLLIFRIALCEPLAGAIALLLCA